MSTYIVVVRIYLTPKHDIILTNFTGTVVESFLLKLIDNVEPGLSDKLHNTRGPKPFSVTPFFIGKKPIIGIKPVHVQAGSKLWFRISIIGDLAIRAIPQFLDLIDKEVTFFKNSIKLIVENVEVDIVDINTLFNNDVNYKAFKINFLTPTRFALRRPRRSKRARFCFCPDAWRIIKSSLKHWRYFTNIHISDKVIQWAYQYVILADFGPFRGVKSNVITVRLPRGGIARGYVGFALYQILGRRRLSEFWALIRYAELMNVGTGRSMGLGVISVKKLECRKVKTTS